jgi:hypothetical protein
MGGTEMGRWVLKCRTAAISLGVVVLLMAATAGRPDMVVGQDTGGDNLLRELAERLLAIGGPIASEDGRRAQLYPGAMPPETPFEIPVPPGTTVIGSAVRPVPAFGPQPPGSERIDVVLDVPGAAGDVIAFYREALGSLGWSAPATPRGPLPGGFLPSGFGATPSTLTLCEGPNGPWLSVNAYDTADGISDVRLSTETRGGGPCGQQGAIAPSFPPGADLLPPLPAPAEAQVSPRGGGGGGSVWNSNAVATTEMSVVELEAFYAEQLAGMGWTRTGGGTDSALAWSAWRLPDAGDWHGLLYVQGEPEDRSRLLYVQVASVSQQGQGSGGVIVTPR